MDLSDKLDGEAKQAELINKISPRMGENIRLTRNRRKEQTAEGDDDAELKDEDGDGFDDNHPEHGRNAISSDGQVENVLLPTFAKLIMMTKDTRLTDAGLSKARFPVEMEDDFTLFYFAETRTPDFLRLVTLALIQISSRRQAWRRVLLSRCKILNVGLTGIGVLHVVHKKLFDMDLHIQNVIANGPKVYTYAHTLRFCTPELLHVLASELLNF
jgi:hypothetical protein